MVPCKRLGGSAATLSLDLAHRGMRMELEDKPLFNPWNYKDFLDLLESYASYESYNAPRSNANRAKSNQNQIKSSPNPAKSKSNPNQIQI